MAKKRESDIRMLYSCLPCYLRRTSSLIFMLITVLLLTFLQGCSSRQSTGQPSSLPGDMNQSFLSLTQIIDGDQTVKIRRFARIRSLLFGRSNTFGLVRPTDMTVDATGRLLVVDSEASSVQIFTELESEWALEKIVVPEGVVQPVSITNSKKRIYISDLYTKTVHQFDYDFKPLGEISYKAFIRPGDLYFCNINGRLIVTDPPSHQVFIFNEEGENITSVGRDERGEGLLQYPVAVTVDSKSGELYVLDGIARKVKHYDKDYHFMDSFGRYDQVPGTFAFPKGLAMGLDETLFISDAAFGNVQLFNTEGVFLFTFGITGKEPAQFLVPGSLYMDSDQRLYVAEPYNNRIQIFQYHPQQ